jgi:xanthine dehydrogenase accessory factor
MLVLEQGSIMGTLGGGCVEAEVRARALELLESGQDELLTFRLDHDYGWDDGLICGGQVQIYVQIQQGPEAAERFTQVVQAIRERRPTVFRFEYSSDICSQEYVEMLNPSPCLIIAGGGHIGCALSRLAVDLGFYVVVMDDRPEFATPTRFPHVHRCVVGRFESELESFPIDDNTYIVIVTRGHKRDGRALAAVIASPARYIGLIGSKRKVLTIMNDLHAGGVAVESLKKVHGPIGLEINAISVEEIAISIAAELVAVRRGLDGMPAFPMRVSPEMIDRKLQRK